METKKRHKKIVLGVMFSVIALVLLAIALPVCQDFAISCAEKFLHRGLRRPDKWKEIIMRVGFFGVFIIAISAFFSLTKYGEKVVSDIKSETTLFVKELKEKDSLFSLLVVILFLFFCFYKILDSDYIYQDDAFRHVSGTRGWIEFGHYIAEFCSIVFHNAIRIQDVAPLLQFFSIFIMAITLALIAFILTGKIKLQSLFLLSVMFVTPFYAQNMSYRYDDCLFMTLSISFTAIPFLFIDKQKSFFVMSFICLNFSLMSYKAGNVLYILLTIFIAYEMLQKNTTLKNSNVWKFVCSAIVCYAVALLFYNAVFASKISAGYFDSTVSISSVPANIVIYTKSMVSNFGGTWMKFFLALSVVISIIVSINNSNQKFGVSIFLTLFAVSFAYCLSYAPYIIFAKPPFTMRSCFGFNILVALLLLNIYLKTGDGRKILYVPPICLIFTCVVFLYTYGTCLSDQKRYEDFRSTVLLSDLNKFSNSSEKKFLRLVGGVGHSDAYKIAMYNYPVIEKLIAGLPYEGPNWCDEFFNMYNFNCEEIYIPDDHGFPLLISTNYHDIYGQDNKFYIVLK